MSSEDYRGRPGTDPGTDPGPDPDPGTDRGQAAAYGAGSGRQRLYGQDLPLCQGIATALRHVTDLPAAETREEAVQMFEEMAPPTRYVAASSGMGDPEQADRLNRADGAGRRPGEGRGGGGAGGEETYVSCYGTTDVQVLTVQEIETEPVEDVAGEEPLQGWHPLDALGSVPEGGLFGLLGGMGGGAGGGMRSLSTSRSTSTRMVNGRQVTTTTTTTVENGKETRRTETIVRNPDGSMEMTVVDDDDGQGNPDRSRTPLQLRQEQQDLPGAAGGSDLEEIDRMMETALGSDMGRGIFSPLGGIAPFQPSHRIVRKSEPEITAIVPECKVGVTVSTVETDTEGDTIAAVRLGPVEIAVGDSYDIVDEDAQESVASKGKGEGFKGVGAGGDDRVRGGERRKAGGLFGDGLFGDDVDPKEMFVSTVEKTATSMMKNAETLKQELSDDFPSRVMKSGERVVGSFSKQVDRMEKLGASLYKIWSGEDRPS